MKTYLADRLRSAALGVLALFIGMLVAVTTLAWFPSQNPKKVFRKQDLLMSPEIVKVVDIERNTKKFAFGVEIDGDDDWLHGTKFTLKNFSERTVVFIALHLNFPETKSLGNEMSFPIYVGRNPGIENQTADPIAITPNEELTIAIDDKTYSGLKRFFEYRQSISSINQVTVVPYLVVFEDGIAWGQGEYYRRDPANKRGYIPIGKRPPQ